MDEMKTNHQLYCTHCGCVVEEDEFNTVGEDIGREKRSVTFKDGTEITVE